MTANGEIDASRLRALCLAAAGLARDRLVRIRSVAQTAHEILGTRCLVVCMYDTDGDFPSVVAHPGVRHPEYMGGPATSEIMLRQAGECVDGALPNESPAPDIVWLADDHAWGAYIGRVQNHVGSLHPGATRQGGFRGREDVVGCPTAICHLWRGDAPCRLGGDLAAPEGSELVGRVFLTFQHGYECTPVLEGAMRAACVVLRELIISEIAVRRDTQAEWVLDHWIDRANEIVDVAIPDGRYGRVLRLEVDLTKLIEDAAAHAIGETGAQTRLVLLLGRYTLRYRDPLSSTACLATRHLDPASVASYCCRNRVQYFGHRNPPRVAAADPFVSVCHADIDSAEHDCAVIRPVSDRDGVKAFLYITMPQIPREPLKYGRTLAALEILAQHVVSRIRSFRRRVTMEAAMRFLGEPMKDGRFYSSLTEMVKASGAAYGHYVPITADGGFEDGVIMQDGQWQSAALWKDWQPKPSDRGFSSIARDSRTDAMIVLHFYRDKGSSSQREYACQVLGGSRQSPTLDFHHREELADAMSDFAGVAAASSDQLGKHHLKPVDPTSPGRTSTIPGAHTSICLPVKSAGRVVGVFWLAFDQIQPISWWDQQYLWALAQRIADNADLVLSDVHRRNVGHNAFPKHEVAASALEAVVAGLGSSSPAVMGTAAKIQAFMDVIEAKSAELEMLGHPQHGCTNCRPVSVKDAVDRMVALFSGRSPFMNVKSTLTGSTSKTTNILLITALEITLTNAQRERNAIGRTFTARLKVICGSDKVRLILSNTAAANKTVGDVVIQDLLSLQRKSTNGLGLPLLKDLLLANGGTITARIEETRGSTGRRFVTEVTLPYTGT